MNHLAFSDWLANRVRHIESVLETLLPAADAPPARLHDAMRYAVLGGGKRVRAALVYAAAQAVPHAARSSGHAGGAMDPALDRAAAAVELIHAYSLVHDDLPCMDDDTLRRGKPTVHVQYDEAAALLAGDALQALAFALLTDMPVAPSDVLRALRVLTRAAGSHGMAGGQAIDLCSVGRTLTRDELQTMHAMKTGALLAASVALGGIAAGADARVSRALEDYAQAIGLAFQVVDDILDATVDSGSLGKTAGKDASDGKPTYVTMLGLAPARAFAAELGRAARAAIAPLGEAGRRLDELAGFILDRGY